MDRLPHFFDRRRSQPTKAERWLLDSVFWGLLFGATLALVSPLWIGAIPPLTDFGGHAAIADVWCRHEEVATYRRMFTLREGLVPNTLVTRLVSVLYPLVDPLTGLRIVTSVSMAGTVASLVAVTRVFDRSRWLVFLGLPFLWNGSLYWGMVNYVAAIPLFFATIALARKAGLTGEWRWGVALGIACLCSYLAHGLGWPFTLGTSVIVMLLSVESRRGWLQLLAFTPATAAWFIWRSRAAVGHALPSGGLMETIRRDGRWSTPSERIRDVVEATNDALVIEQDTVALAVVAGAWLVLIACSPAADSGDVPSTHDDTEVTWVARGSRLLHRMWSAARLRPLLIVALFLGSAVALLPTYIVGTSIAARVVPLFFLAVVLLPRVPDRSIPAAAAITAAIASSFWFASVLRRETAIFHRTRLLPLLELIEQLPDHARVECIGVRGIDDAVFRGRPLDHNCPGLAQLHTRGFGGFHFPATGYNAIGFRPGFGYISLDDSGFSDIGKLQSWDYVIVRGDHPKPLQAHAKLVDTSHAEGSPAKRWSLYEVRKPAAPAHPLEQAGGGGGEPFEWRCPRDHALTGIDVETAADGHIISRIRPVCSRISVVDDRAELVPRPRIQGPWIGGQPEQESRKQLDCGPERAVVGLGGFQDGLVTMLGVTCGHPHDRDRNNPQKGNAVGEGSGEPFTMRCGPTAMATGLLGRRGLHIDAIGLLCLDASDTSDSGGTQ